METANLDLTALLLQVATQRSKAAYSQLFHYFAPRIRHYGLRHLRSEARAMELVQETLLAVWQKAALLSLFIRCLNFNTSKLWKTTTKNTASTYEHFPLA